MQPLQLAKGPVMSDPFDGSDDLDELAAGRGDVDKIEVPEWLILSGCSARALQLYQLLRLRLNRRRGDRKVWPGLATLAVMMKLTTSESVSPYIKELKQLGAIDVEPGRMPRRNIYRIHFAPSADYAGPACLEDWDGDPRNRLAAKKIRDAEKEKRENFRAKASRTPQAANSLVAPDTGKSPDQARPGKTAAPDTGKIRDQEPGKNTALDPGFFRVEPLGVTEGSSVPRRRTPSSGATATAVESPPQEANTPEQQDSASSKIEDQEGYAADGYPLKLSNWETNLVAELDRLRPEWGPRPIRIVVGHPSVRDRSASHPDMVRRAFLLAAADRARPRDRYKGTWTPNRMLAAGCPFWAQAEAGMAAGEHDSGQPERGVLGQRAAQPTAERHVADVPAPRLGALAPATKPPAVVAAEMAARGWRIGPARVLEDVESAS
jgi:hypothetical protein